ncbi:MAG: hypothetical protein RLZ28_1339 [Actinomycetota bacterium]|jgi:hypothetical protein
MIQHYLQLSFAIGQHAAAISLGDQADPLKIVQEWLPSAVSLLTINLLAAVFVARSAVTKNRDWFTFFWLSLIATSLVMGIVAAALPLAPEHSPDHRKCPACAEFIKREASVCRYCGQASDALPLRKAGRFAGLHPFWWIGSFTVALGLVVEVLALSKIYTESWWLGLALCVVGGTTLIRASRRTR